MKKYWVAIAASITVTMGLALTASPASATVDETATVSSGAQQRINQLFAGVDDSDSVFDGALAVRAGASAEDTDEFAVGYLAAGGHVRNVAVPADEVDALRGTATEVLACSGRNSSDITGLQVNLYLNSCNASKIVAALAGGAGLAALVGIITAATGIGGAAGAIAAALLTIGSAAIAYCAANGRGIGFHVLPVGPPWCKSQ
jgi:hypothetical protein